MISIGPDSDYLPMLQRIVSRPYLYTAVVMISGAMGYFFGVLFGFLN